MPDPKKIMVKVPKAKKADSKESKNITSSENNIELTKKYSTSLDNMEKNLNSDKGKNYTEKTQGIVIEKENMVAKPLKFKRKIIKTGGDNGTTKIMSSDGKTVKYEGRSNMQSTKDALRDNEK